MSVFKPIVLSAAIVAALTSFASAATRHHHAAPTKSGYSVQYYDNAASANTGAAENFQNQFKNTY